MTNGRKYKNPPVVEALCELFFTDSAWDDTVPGRFYDCIKHDFPNKKQKEIQKAEVSFSAAGETTAGMHRLAPRIQFFSEKGDRLIQLGQDLLVVNQLRPYPRFEEWEPVVYTAFDKYTNMTQPATLAQVGVRYINKVVIPETRIRMEDYFTVYPNLPSNMGDEHGTFMVRFELSQQQGEHTVIVTFGSSPAEQPGSIAHLLDLYDIFEPEGGIPLDTVRTEVQTGHNNVESAFEGSITDRLRAVLQEET